MSEYLKTTSLSEGRNAPWSFSKPLTRRIFLYSAPFILALPAASFAKPSELDASTFGISKNSKSDQTGLIQSALNKAALQNQTLVLPEGRYRLEALDLPFGAKLKGAGNGAKLKFSKAGITATGSGDILLQNLDISGDFDTGIRFESVSGSVSNCQVSGASNSGIFANDSAGLTIENCRVSDCGNNGILVWRSTKSYDGTRITGNRVSNIKARSGGNGQNGNGINIFRASGCEIRQNTLQDCAFTGIRVNNGDDSFISENQIKSVGEVGLFIEFGASSSLISDNVLEDVGAGISITNADFGGRLATLTGNKISGLRTTPSINPDLIKPFGISAEHDVTITNNTIENGATATGMNLGWGPYCKGLIAVNNTFRALNRGIDVSVAPDAQAAIITDNRFENIASFAIAGTAWYEVQTGELLGAGHVMHSIANNIRITP